MNKYKNYGIDFETYTVGNNSYASLAVFVGPRDVTEVISLPYESYKTGDYTYVNRLIVDKILNSTNTKYYAFNANYEISFIKSQLLIMGYKDIGGRRETAWPGNNFFKIFGNRNKPLRLCIYKDAGHLITSICECNTKLTGSLKTLAETLVIKGENRTRLFKLDSGIDFLDIETQYDNGIMKQTFIDYCTRDALIARHMKNAEDELFLDTWKYKITIDSPAAYSETLIMAMLASGDRGPEYYNKASFNSQRIMISKYRDSIYEDAQLINHSEIVDIREKTYFGGLNGYCVGDTNFGEVKKDVVSGDLTSGYPYILSSYDFPLITGNSIMTNVKRINIDKWERTRDHTKLYELSVTIFDAQLKPGHVSSLLRPKMNRIGEDTNLLEEPGGFRVNLLVGIEDDRLHSELAALKADYNYDSAYITAVREYDLDNRPCWKRLQKMQLFTFAEKQRVKRLQSVSKEESTRLNPTYLAAKMVCNGFTGKMGQRESYDDIRSEIDKDGVVRQYNYGEGEQGTTRGVHKAAFMTMYGRMLIAYIANKMKELGYGVFITITDCFYATLNGHTYAQFIEDVNHVWFSCNGDTLGSLDIKSKIDEMALIGNLAYVKRTGHTTTLKVNGITSEAGIELINSTDNIHDLIGRIVAQECLITQSMSIAGDNGSKVIQQVAKVLSLHSPVILSI